MRILTETEILQLLDIPTCIGLLEPAMILTARGGTQQPLRQVLRLPGDRVFGVMPGYLSAPEQIGLKSICVFPRPEDSPYQSHQGAVLVFDPATGFMRGLLDAGAVTGLRTAAASALATGALARPDSARLAILGAGHQAECHLEAMLAVRAICDIRIWARNPDRAKRFARRQAERHGVEVHAAPSVGAAVKGADIVCTTTSAREPILCGELLEPGMHLNVVGSSTADAREIDVHAVARARFFCDSRAAVLAQGGEFLAAKASGCVEDGHVLGEIGSVLGGELPGRTASDDITLYKSLGIIAQDLAVAVHLLTLAEARNRGTTIELRAHRHPAL